MNNEDQPRAIRFSLWVTSTSIGQFAFFNKKRALISLFLFLLITHSFYWLSAWYSPWPFLIFNLIGIWFAQGILNPWGTIISQATHPDWDPAILKISLPFIVLNYIAFFACLYMFGTVTENNISPIKGTWKHFYFSAVTLTTLGYGNIVPSDLWSEIVATIQSIIGFMGFAILAGVVASIAIKRVELKGKA
jgi:Ion channel